MTKEQIKTALDAGVCNVTLNSGAVLKLTTKLDLVAEDFRPTTMPDGAGETLVTWNTKANRWQAIKASSVASVA